jgi:hypothetical protein
MNVEIKWFNEQFNVHLSSKEGAEPFLEIKGCRIASGSKGPFVSWPSTKNQQTGKYWNHVYGSEKFAAVVLSKAQETMPKQEPRSRPQSSGARADADQDIPFNRAFRTLAE